MAFGERCRPKIKGAYITGRIGNQLLYAHTFYPGGGAAGCPAHLETCGESPHVIIFTLPIAAAPVMH